MSDRTREILSGDDILDIVCRFSHDKDAVADYCHLQNNIMKLDNLEQEVNEILGSVSDKESVLTDSLNNIAEMKRKVIDWFLSSHKDKLTTADKGDDAFDYSLDDVSDDEIKTFRDYYKKFCHYRYEFYCRSDRPNLDRKEEYRLEAETLKGLNDATRDGHRTFPQVSFTFKLNTSKPFDVSVKELEQFQSGVMACMKSLYYTSTHQNQIYHADVLRDDIGRMIERKNPSNLFDRWERCLNAYDLNDPGKTKLADIAKQSASIAVRNKSKQSRQFNNDIDAASAAKKDIIEAERLIVSAAKGTFPY